ncbi:MAG: DUF971 domain-containing protein [Psychrosphaera sp.]|nr:DUF971 domain-containing protein [Psychrosphaera sp.]
MTIKAIKYHKKQRQLEVVFGHGEQASFSAEFLRVHSPSAEVTGHSPEQAVLVTNKKDVTISNIEPVGNYAIKITFDDGHNTGLFSWTYLEHLRQNQPRLWQSYLDRLKAARAHRDAIIPIRLG